MTARKEKPGLARACFLLLLGIPGCATPPVAARDSTAVPEPALMRVEPAASVQAIAPHGFVIHSGADTFAVTAHHVLPSFEDVTPSGVVLRSPIDNRLILPLGAGRTIDNARTIGGSGSQHDMAAFRVRDAGRRALRLATAMPALDDTVIVLAVMADQPLRYRHRARVVVVHDSAFVYVYLDARNPGSTSGAAVLNANDEVVGINVGTLEMTADRWQLFRQRYGACCNAVASGEIVGLAVSMRAMRQHLRIPVSP